MIIVFFSLVFENVAVPVFLYTESFIKLSIFKVCNVLATTLLFKDCFSMRDAFFVRLFVFACQCALLAVNNGVKASDLHSGQHYLVVPSLAKLSHLNLLAYGQELENALIAT